MMEGAPAIVGLTSPNQREITVPNKAELNERDTKLVQWLDEAHVKEAELEADLVAHIALTQKASYKKRLQQHLKETRQHKRQVATRIRKFGAKASNPSPPVLSGAVGEAAGKAVAAVKGQAGVARAIITGTAETHLHNAQEELRAEHVEIALYTRLEVLATEVGDRDTAQLAKAIRREEERMAKYLTAELTRLVKDVVRDEIPREQRATKTRARAKSSSRPKPRARTTRPRPTATTRSRSRS
jgi:ferritin-like metal-binding protein YciE